MSDASQRQPVRRNGLITTAIVIWTLLWSAISAWWSLFLGLGLFMCQFEADSARCTDVKSGVLATLAAATMWVIFIVVAVKRGQSSHGARRIWILGPPLLTAVFAVMLDAIFGWGTAWSSLFGW
ncbi:hypothetical protein Vau01_007500 [Virgisporangium aurantiacum]|uniref:Uncharacterized protein n=2 Tax=Virgisporangium aurantiacum TaxID=175570 RepID=A0A8J3YX23_9ACTN|nr:hypothetical protein Vau01_007500 [Virgisporangium aurantiacum]